MSERRPGTVPLSALRHYQVRPYHTPDRIAKRGDFYIMDGWLRPSMEQGHGKGRDAVFLVHFDRGDDDRMFYFVLDWSPLREKIIELVLRGGSPVGPCRLVAKPLLDDLNLWVIVGVEDDGTVFDPLHMAPLPQRPDPAALVI